MSLDSNEKKLAIPILYDDLLLLHVFLNNVELHQECSARGAREPKSCLQAILGRHANLQDLGVIHRLDRLVMELGGER